ncbi:MAG TPA: hybrid sensor histidine kinase/response regulator [Candidatus Aquilonibacter sp.]|nr:hybrid sensor histidine kinase/response regulator [Candidatus Aquilonibacter sp.]
MSTRDEEFEKKLRATFRVEADEHVRAMSSRLVELEKTSSDEERASLVEIIFREAHSLKGAARAVNAQEIESICQSMESVFSVLKRKGLSFSPGLFDVLHSCVDTIGTIVVSAEVDHVSTQTSRTSKLIQALEKILKGALPASNPGMKHSRKPPAPTSETPAESKEKTGTAKGSPSEFSPAGVVRVSTAKLNSLLLQVEELRAPKMALGQHLAELRELGGPLATWTQETAAVRSELRTLRETLEGKDKTQKSDDIDESRQKAVSQIIQLSGLLERNSVIVEEVNSNFGGLLRLAEQDHRILAAMMASLLEDARKLSLVPFSSLLEGFPKLVRDLCRDRGKDAELVVAGGEIETDRRILEEIKDPLIHLLRNCIDHGIETSVERERKGKAPKGTIAVSITPKDGDKVEVLLSDDGSGIDVAKIRSAVAAGGGPKEQMASLSDEAVLPFIFQSGVSTSPIITNLSGRGLGLAIAREKVEKLGGTLTVETRHTMGTTFRMVLPLTLATFRGVLVRSGELLFIIPTTYIERVTRVSRGDIKTVENRETIPYGGGALSLARFRDILELNGNASDPAEKLHVLILRAAGERIAFQVDEILSEQEVLAKPFGEQLSRVRNLAGATILGTGKTVPIVNVHDLIKSAVKSGGTAAPATHPAQAIRKSILIAEDSITARTLLKNIVESAGYAVKTAVDGLDAYTTLKAGDFDLVVSDVEMPRMTGFDLTAKIRADKKLSETPVVLVTALDSREDRERGIDVGANAYIVKSSFDHGDLLKTIQRLI